MRSDFVDRRTAVVVTALLLVGLALRWTGLDASSLWFDEGLTWGALSMSQYDIALESRHPPLSFLAFEVWASVFGDSVLALRSLSALFSSLALLLFSAIALRQVDRRAACIAILLAALSPFLIHHGQELRMYPLVEGGTMLAILGATRGVNAGRVTLGNAACIAIGVAIAFGSHYYGALLAVPLALMPLTLRAFGLRWDLGSSMRCLAAATLGILVWLPWCVPMLPLQLQNEWGYTDRFSMRELVELPLRFLLHEVQVLPGIGQAWILVVSLVLVVAMLLAAIDVVHRRDVFAAFAWTLLLVPIAVILAGRLVGQHSFAVRYLYVAAPGAILVFAVGLARLRPDRLAAMVVVVVAGGLAWLAVAPKLTNRNEDFRSAATGSLRACSPATVSSSSPREGPSAPTAP